MYLYFDKKGTLKEIINDEALRQGNYNVNVLYIYVEDRAYDSIDVSYLLESNLFVGPMNYDDFEESSIPYNAKRDLRFFKYNQKYNFCVIPLEADLQGNSPLDEAGIVHCSLAIIGNEEQLALGEVNFNVEMNSTLNQKQVASEQYMSLSDYLFLRHLLSGDYGPLVTEQYLSNNYVPLEPASDDSVSIGSSSKNFAYVNTRRIESNDSIVFDSSEESYIFVGEDGSVALSSAQLDHDYILYLPDKSAGTYTLATTDDIVATSGVPYQNAVADLDLGENSFITEEELIVKGRAFDAYYGSEGIGVMRSSYDVSFSFPIIGEYESTSQTFATQEWCDDRYLQNNSDADIWADNFTGNSLTAGKVYDVQLEIFNNRIVKNVDGCENSFYFPDATGAYSSSTFNIATREWVTSRHNGIYDVSSDFFPSDNNSHTISLDEATIKDIAENATALVHSYSGQNNSTWKVRFPITYCDSRYDSSNELISTTIIYTQDWPNDTSGYSYVEFKVSYKFEYVRGSYCRVRRIANVDNS